jgi:very-short-patch-repair endonuclease
VAIVARPTAGASEVSTPSTVSGFRLDFVCFEKRLIIEVDGSQHASSARDAAREAVLATAGFRIVRYWNNDVLQQPAAILEDILAKLTRL